jgi:hypothetical protein
MPKIFTSPVKRFPGNVTLKEPLMLPEALAIGKAIREVKLLRETAQAKGLKDASLDERLAVYVPAICQCIEKAEVTGFPEHPTPETYPFTPIQSAMKLTMWLLDEVQTIYFTEEEETNPNA